ncbi:unnamed protein product [Ilex paraguariensis]|uniref:SURP motif domain-containing protein n=1 Tax=Ilex paraguariensis TaxID=185542 RepID=A0ABC8QR39_9AQUA
MRRTFDALASKLAAPPHEIQADISLSEYSLHTHQALASQFSISFYLSNNADSVWFEFRDNHPAFYSRNGTRFDPPAIPKTFLPHHKFPASLEIENYFASAPPPEVPPPDDSNLKVLIEGVATLVARCGKLFEDLSKEKNQSNPLFSFLTGGNGHDYYTMKLWEERRKHKDQTKQKLDGKMSPRVQKMTAESRGKILAEKPLERTTRDTSSPVTSADTVNLQFNLSDTFTKPETLTAPIEVAKPFRDDPAKQQRFEQFLKEKYHGGLRSRDSGGAGSMSEAARARERLEFEAAAEAVEKGQWRNEKNNPHQQLLELSSTSGLQFTSGGLEQVKVSQPEDSVMRKMNPKREEFQWRPSPILCKRFDIIDPYMGKPPPVPRVRSKMDSLIFMSDSAKAARTEGAATINMDPLTVLQSGSEKNSEEVMDREIDIQVEVENVERPVDLYKAIFSDDSDDEEDNASLNLVVDPQKKTEAANTTLSRLIAGDFLESLGKELGLEVPSDLPHSKKEASPPFPQKEVVNANKRDNNTIPEENKLSVPNAGQGRPYHSETAQAVGSHKQEFLDGNPPESGGKITKIGSSENNRSVKNNLEAAQRDTMAKSPLGQNRNWSCGSSEDERSRKRSRHRRHRSSNSSSDTTDLSDDYRDRHHSRSKGRKKGSYREKSSSRKHSKHHKHRSRNSPSISHHGSEKGHGEDKREKRKWKD